MQALTIPRRSGTRVLNRIGAVLANLGIMLFTISCIFPIIWILYSSLKTNAEFANSIISLPETFQFSNYVEAFNMTKMPLFMLNSFRTTVISLILIVLLSFVTAYFIARFRFKGRKLMYLYYLFGLIVPIHALLVPVYLLFKNTGLADQWYTLVIPYVAYNLSFPIFLIESYINKIPREMEEAAAIDGSSFTRTLFTIILPMSLPVIATVAIMQFFSCWNEFAFALVLINEESLRTVPLGLTYFKAQHDTDYPQLMAGMIIALLPVAVVYFSFSSYIIKGVSAGAVKE